MTPADFIAARKSLGHTQHSMSEALHMGRWGWQTISKWETGKQPIPGPVRVAVELMLERSSEDEERS